MEKNYGERETDRQDRPIRFSAQYLAHICVSVYVCVYWKLSSQQHEWHGRD